MSDNIFLTNRTLKNKDNYLINRHRIISNQKITIYLIIDQIIIQTPFNQKVQFNLPEDNIPFFTDYNEFGYDQNTNLLQQNP